MLEEEFTGDERHEVVPINWLRHGLLNKRMRWGSSSWLSILNFASWKIRNFNLKQNAHLEFWRDDIGPAGKLKGIGACMCQCPCLSLGPFVARVCVAVSFYVLYDIYILSGPPCVACPMTCVLCTNHPPLLSVNMIGAKVEHMDPKQHKQCDGNSHCFRVIPAEGSEDDRVLVLMASSQAEADAWVESLNMATCASSDNFLDGLSAKTKSLGSTHSKRTIDLTPDEE
jgi:hypothetical protein